MKWYTRKDINKQTDRFKGTKFAAEDDFMRALQVVVQIAVDCGADEAKLVEVFAKGNDE